MTTSSPATEPVLVTWPPLFDGKAVPAWYHLIGAAWYHLIGVVWYHLIGAAWYHLIRALIAWYHLIGALIAWYHLIGAARGGDVCLSVSHNLFSFDKVSNGL